MATRRNGRCLLVLFGRIEVNTSLLLNTLSRSARAICRIPRELSMAITAPKDLEEIIHAREMVSIVAVASPWRLLLL